VILVAGALASITYYLVTRGKGEVKPTVEGSVRVEILNGCGQAGVARRAKAYLRDEGYDILSIGDARGLFAETIIVERLSPANVNARSLARTLRLNEKSVTQSLDSLSPVWVTLIIGQDYKHYLPDTVETIQ
jgi:hypothetical protein